MKNRIHAFLTMLRVELRLSLRGMDMVIFSLVIPVGVMAVLGLIYGDKPAFEGAAYTFVSQSFGAVSTIGVCASGVMGLPLVLSDYRHRKILRRYRVTPVSPALLLAVQVAQYALYSVASLFLVWGTAFLFGLRMSGPLLPFLGAFTLVLVSMFSIGVLVAGVSPNTKISGLLCSVLYFPMLLLSGATLPYENLPAVLQHVADVMPLTQGIKLLKAVSLGLPSEGMLFPAAVMAALAVVCTGASLRFFRWE